MANVSTTLVIKSKNETQQGINEAKSSFQEFTSSIDSLTGGLGSRISTLLANPWTGVAAAVGVAAKSLKELTAAGMEGQDRLLKFSAMLGSKGEASSLIGTISKLSDTSFESRDAIEAFAEKLIGAGRSAEDVEKILSATIDISNTSGRSFKEVGTAIENAFAGKTTQIEKMVPGLKNLGDEAWNSGDAIKYIGDELHDASIQIASGSLSNQLGAIGNSWQQIKENLGTSIVTQIQATGVLDTIANWLEKIETNTAKAVADRAAAEDIQSLIAQGGVRPESVAFQLANKYSLEELWSASGYLSVEDYNKYVLPLFETTKGGDLIGWSTVAKTFQEQGKLGGVEGLQAKVVEAEAAQAEYERYANDPNYQWDPVTKSWKRTVESLRQEWLAQGKVGYRENLAYQAQFTSFTKPTTTKAPATEVRTTLNELERLLYATPEIWTGSGYGNAESLYTKITNAYATGSWGNVTDEDWAQIDAALAGLDVSARQAWQDGITPIRMAYDLAKVEPPAVEYKRDYSVLGLAMQDMGLGYAPVGYDTVAPSYQAFGVSSLWLNGINAPGFRMGVGQDLSYFNTGAGRRTTGGGGINTMEGWFLDANGTWQNVEEYEKEQAKIAKEEQEAEEKRFNDITGNIKTVISTLQSVTNIWKDGYQTGDLSSTISAVGGAIGGKWGTILSLVGMGGSLLSSWLGGGEEIDLSGTTDADYQTSLATYNGGLNLTINNNFEGANIVGAGGMEELAMTVQRQIEHWAYDNR